MTSIFCGLVPLRKVLTLLYLSCIIFKEGNNSIYLMLSGFL